MLRSLAAFALLVGVAHAQNVDATSTEGGGWKMSRSSTETVASKKAESNGSAAEAELLTVQCKDESVTLIISTIGGFWGASSRGTLHLIYQIGDRPAVQDEWPVLETGRGAFISSVFTITFVHDLPDPGTISIRVTDQQGAPHDAAFDLGGIRQARGAVFRSCNIPGGG
jgi:hypothetical protein